MNRILKDESVIGVFIECPLFTEKHKRSNGEDQNSKVEQSTLISSVLLHTAWRK